MIQPSQIINALKHVFDPDLKKDLISLKMVENIEVNNSCVKFKLVLTTPSCPLKDKIATDCREAIAQYVSSDLKVEIEFDSRVTSARINKKDILPQVKNIIAISSGKGGVGKSTISVNFALSLVATGAKVGIIDADIHGPSIPIMLGIKGKRPETKVIDGKHYIIPLEQYGLKVISIGLLVDERQAVVWRGPMVASALRQFVTDVIWDELDYLIVDLPPGTGDIHLSLIQTLPVTGAIIVTTPQDVAISDARKGMGMFYMEGIKVPIIGVVENMAYFTPTENPDKQYYIFGKNGGLRLANEFDVPFLGQIPIVESISSSGDEGLPAMLNQDLVSKNAFIQVAAEAERQIAILNAKTNEDALKMASPS